MSDTSPRLALPFIQPAQAQKHVTHNEALERLDLVTQLTVEAFDATQPPSLPQDGQIWALGQGSGGVWTGHDGALAAWIGSGWQFITPAPGWRAAAGNDLRLWTGSAWVGPGLGSLDNLPGLGVNTGFDMTNRLAVAASATLLTHDGSDHQLKIDKATPGDTASLLFQTSFSGRAEMGTTGTDNFSVKVSPDGATWLEGIVIDCASGQALFPNGIELGNMLTGSGAANLPALRSDSSDTGEVTAAHLRAILASRNSQAFGTISAVVASDDAIAEGPRSAVIASEDATASGSHSVVIGGDISSATGDNSYVASSTRGIASGRRAMVLASRRTINSVAESVAMGDQGAAGDASEANRTIHMFSSSGNIQIAGSLSSSHSFSDFAEMFPNGTGEEIPLGTIVSESEGSVSPAQDGDGIAGVVTATAVVTAGDTPFAWQGRYLSDEWGRPLYEETPDPDHEGDGPAPMVQVRKENPDWNPDLPQVKRSERPDEWTRVGLLGQVFTRVAEHVQPNDRLAADNGIGVKSTARTGLRCMKITSPYDAARGYAIARCLVNLQV